VAYQWSSSSGSGGGGGGAVDIERLVLDMTGTLASLQAELAAGLDGDAAA
jgi:hypothetical protein